MAITASMVKNLRAATGVGMMDCKNALVESNGDLELATNWLRKRGLAAAAKKSNRLASEGLTAVATDGLRGTIIEINSETDFVARNTEFQKLVREIAVISLDYTNIDYLKKAKINSQQNVEEKIIANISTIGENLNLRRMKTLRIKNGVISSYVHNTSFDNMGKISVIVAIESDGDKSKLNELGKNLAMHIAATKPQSLNGHDLDPSLIEKEREIFIEQSKNSGKPNHIIEKMVDGRIRKFLEEIVLLDQTFVMDGKTKIKDLISKYSNELGAPILIKDFARLELGEGLEKEETNFAEEVASINK